MLRARSRLTKHIIEENLVRARRIKTFRFLVMYSKLPTSEGPRIGFVVSKKIAPRAVLRNRLRRLGYSAIAELIPHMPKEMVMLINYTKSDTTVPLKELTKELNQAFIEAGIYKK